MRNQNSFMFYSLLSYMPKIKPIVDITYSPAYDKQIHFWKGLEFKRPINLKEYRQEFINKWEPVERKVFDTMSAVSGLSWKKPIIDCYLVQRTIAFSMPLTLPMQSKLDDLIEVLIHELVHNIVVQNRPRINWKKCQTDYPELHNVARIHILVHSILKLVLIEIFGKEKTKEHIKNQISPHYKKAWDIVEQEGAAKLIKKYISCKKD